MALNWSNGRRIKEKRSVMRRGRGRGRRWTDRSSWSGRTRTRGRRRRNRNVRKSGGGALARDGN